MALLSRSARTSLQRARPRFDAARHGHVTVGPFSVFDGGLGEAAAFCMAAIESGAGAKVATANLDFIARARRDRALRQDLADSTLVVADGAPVAWLARLAGASRVSRVTGVDLVAELCRRGSERGGLRIAFYGSNPATSAAAAETLRARYPGVRVVARISPPFRPPTPAETAADRALLARAKPELVLVALGCPRQERFIAESYHDIPGAVWIGVGGTFDFYAGEKKRAPRLLQAMGGEWLARLAQDPRRLWRRYLLDDLPALVAVATPMFATRLRRHPR